MAEVKNAFIKSKMNKDLDARLIPQGEYRDAVNIQVSKSEGDDVGALENVLGNFSLFDVVNDTGVPNLKCIGYFVDNSNSVVYLFFTDNNLTAYNPNGQNFIYSYNANSADLTLLVQGTYLNFSKNNPIIGVNLLEDFLFFTDNRNQPRKINVNLASTQGTGYYTNEDQISVAKYFPYQTIEVIKESTLLPGSFETTMKDAFSEFIPINEGTGGVPLSPNINNPYYETNFPGDPQFLEDKFARFSYRFKFLDGEYSLIAPFTQPCFIPKQDGYFLQGDESQTVISTVVEFMENKVNKIALQIPSPRKTDGNAANSAELNTYFHISEIDILYKESDSLALQVVETLQVSEITVVNNFFEYIYNSTKPYRTLPEKEITRVYDKVPVKALGQEIISNRVVYSNFQDKHTPPSGIKYQVGATEKYEPAQTYSSKTSIEYPNHSLKQNRNYQVGVVLSDRYGRQSTVILSNEVGAGTGDFGADTVYLPYRVLNDSISFLGDSLKIAFNEPIESTQNLTSLTPGLYDGNVVNASYKPLGWYSYKIVVKQLEQEYYNVYLPSAMKGEPYWFNGNPPVPTPTLPRDQNASYVILLNDNINKVPRDLTEVGAQDKQFRSSVRLFGRVENTVGAFSNIGNAQFFPGRNDFTVNQIEDLYDAFDTLRFIGENSNSGDVIPITSSFNPYYAFLRSESNPFMAEFVTSQTPDDQFGVINEGWNQQNPPTTIYEVFNGLAILETKPTVSRLDLFYETSTSDLISNLNQAINSGGGSGDAANEIVDFNYNHDESDAPGTDISGTFYFENFVGTKLTSATATLNYVFDDTGSNIDIKDQFYLDTSLPGGDFILKTASVADGKPADAYFYYGSNPLPRQYTFGFQVTSGSSVRTIPATGNLANVVPTINNSNASPINATTGQSVIIGVLDGVNGSNTSNPTTSTYTQELTWSVTTLGGNAVFGISADGTKVLNSNASAAGTSTFELNLQDAGGANATPKTFTVFFGQPQIPTDLNSISKFLADGDGYAIWFTDNTSNLSTNLPDFGSPNFGSVYLNGFEAPSSLSSTVTNDVCPTSTTFNADFENVTKSTGLTQGTFYVIVRGINNNQPLTGTTNVFSRYAVQYRATKTDAWQSVADFNNTSISGTNVGGTWRYGQGTQTIEGFYNGSGDFLTAEVQSTYPNPLFGISQKVLAFDEIGEYRIIYGNLASNFGEFQFGVNCSSAGTQDLQVNGRIEVGDFYYPSAFWRGDNDGVYEYRVASNNSCSNLFSSNGTAYYAAEPFAKYVTQLFTDTLLLTPANLTGTLRFRRMETRGSSAVSNPEYTKDGAYTATFATGLINSVPSPCLYT